MAKSLRMTRLARLAKSQNMNTGKILKHENMTNCKEKNKQELEVKYELQNDEEWQDYEECTNRLSFK